MSGDFWTAFFENLSALSKLALTSNVLTSLMSSLAGAFAGAWTAKRIAESSKLREELLKEIRNTNAAVAMLYGIANAHLGMKRQHIKRLRDTYDEERKNLNLFLDAKKAGRVPPQQVYEFQADMMTLKPTYSPMEKIQELIFDKISSQGAVLFTAPTLFAAYQSLNESLIERNEIITEWKTHPPKDLVAVYFGLPQGRTVDVRYQNIVDAIYLQTDDVIAFSKMIADELIKHAISQKEIFERKFRATGPEVSKFQISDALDDLLPLASECEGFAKNFKTSKKTPKSRFRTWWTGK